LSPPKSLFVSTSNQNSSEARGPVQAPLKTTEQDNKLFSNLDLWHQRLGHLNYNAVQRTLSQVEGISVSCLKNLTQSLCKCEACAIAKLPRLPFSQKPRKRESQPFVRIHSDVCGPMRTLTSGGKRYVVTFICDATDFVRLYLLRTKDEVFEKLQEFYAEVDTQFSVKIKKLRCDGGGEYVSNEMKKWLSARGILIEQTVADTPQLNGKAERMFRTLFEMARTFLRSSGLATSFWGEAIISAAYIRNRVCGRNKIITPYEAVYQVKPNLRHLRVFGCATYARILDHARHKLQDKATKCILLGYSDTQRGYRLLDAQTRRIIVSRDVIFDETLFPARKALEARETRNMLQVCASKGEDLSVLPMQFNADAEPVADEKTASSLGSHENAPLDEHELKPNKDNVCSDSEILDITPRELPVSPEHEPIAPVRELETKPESDAPMRRSTRYAPTANSLKAIVANKENSDAKAVRKETRRGSIVTATALLADELNDEFFEYAYRMSNGIENFPDPNSLQEARASVHALEWEKGMEEEKASIEENKTWIVIQGRPPKPPIKSRWVFKYKAQPGSVGRFKCRLVGCGYSQRPGIDYGEIFSPVVRHTSIRVFLAVAAHLDLELKHLDVCTAFLHGKLEESESVYMQLPENFNVDGEKTIVKLLKGLYGLKQANRAWNKAMNKVLLAFGFVRFLSEPCIYILRRGSSLLLICVYVDDYFIGYNDEFVFLDFEKHFGTQFKIKNLGNLEWALGLHITRNRSERTISLDQELYCLQILKHFSMSDSKNVDTPELPSLYLNNEENIVADSVPYRSLVGKLMYLMLCTRPDLAAAVRQLSRYLAMPGWSHWEAGKRVLKYLRGTSKLGLTFNGKLPLILQAFADSDFAQAQDRKSVSGTLILLCGGPVSWASKTQSTVSLSSTEAEYTALSEITREIVWLRQLLADMGFDQADPTRVNEDNMQAIGLAHNPEHHARNKHIDVKLHYVREKVEEKVIDVQYIRSEDNLADIFTKPTSVQIFKRHRDKIM